MKALLYKGFRGILKNFLESGTLLDRCVPHLEQGAKHKIKEVVNYHYGESWRRSGNTHPRASKKDTLGVLP